MDWKWRLGFLNGYGEALWQELAGNIRRIMKPIATPNGLMLAKSLPCIADLSAQFPAENFVLGSIDCPEDLAKDADRGWGGSRIIPANGSGLRLQ